MQGAVIITVAAVALFVIFVLINKKSVTKDKEGVVKDVLNKDALLVEFEGQKPMVVKLWGITPASESEMVDDQVFGFLNERVLGHKVLVKPVRLDIGDVVVAGVHSLAGEYVNAAMVLQGFARWAPSEAPNDREIMEAQTVAQQKQVGIWNPAVRQLVEEKMKKAASGELDESDLEDLERPLDGEKG